MASSDGHRSGLLTAGGILTVIAGAFEVIGGGAMVALAVSPAVRDVVLYPWSIFNTPTEELARMLAPRLISVGVVLLVLGAIAIAGGVSAARRKSFGLSLAGAICAVPSVICGLSLARVIYPLNYLSDCARLGSRIFCALPSVILGILAVIFVALGKGEFRKV